MSHNGPPVPLINSTVDASVCGKDALTDSYGWFVQVLLASLAFGLLICKYHTDFIHCEFQILLHWFISCVVQGMDWTYLLCPP